jgi:RNA polymerase sigma-70 factor (ECF subfamily)
MMVHQNLTDQVLLDKCSKGNAQAFHAIYCRYKKYVYSIVKARLQDDDEAMDITQDIFVSLWDNRAQLTAIAEFKSYLYVYARNQVISAYRKKSIRIKGENELAAQLAFIDYSAEDIRLADELIRDINKTVEQLPATMRDCYKLSKNENKRNGEIASILNISEKTVRNNVSEALKRLKMQLRETHPELMFLIVCLFILG